MSTRNALIVRGGWAGHQPVETTESFIPFLDKEGYAVRIEETTGVLADAGVSLLAVATFDTDYLLVQAGSLERAVAALTAAGHSVSEAKPLHAHGIEPSAAGSSPAKRPQEA